MALWLWMQTSDMGDDALKLHLPPAAGVVSTSQDQLVAAQEEVLLDESHVEVVWQAHLVTHRTFPTGQRWELFISHATFTEWGCINQIDR